MPFKGPKAVENKTLAWKPRGLASTSLVHSPAVYQMGQKFSGGLFRNEHSSSAFILTEGLYCRPQSTGKPSLHRERAFYGPALKWNVFSLPASSYNITTRQKITVFFIVCALLQHSNDLYLELLLCFVRNSHQTQTIKIPSAGSLKIHDIACITELREEKQKELQYFCAAELMAEFSPRLMFGLCPGFWSLPFNFAASARGR